MTKSQGPIRYTLIDVDPEGCKAKAALLSNLPSLLVLLVTFRGTKSTPYADGYRLASNLYYDVEQSGMCRHQEAVPARLLAWSHVVSLVAQSEALHLGFSKFQSQRAANSSRGVLSSPCGAACNASRDPSVARECCCRCESVGHPYSASFPRRQAVLPLFVRLFSCAPIDCWADKRLRCGLSCFL